MTNTNGERTRAGAYWGVKSTFTAYISGAEDGTVTALDGAETLDGGRLFFPLDSADGFSTTERSGTIKFGGVVQFTAHRGFLYVEVTEPWIDLDGGLVSIRTVDEQGDFTRVVVGTVGEADIDAHGGVIEVGGIVLTPAGLALFNNVYEPGSELDAISIRLESGS